MVETSPTFFTQQKPRFLREFLPKKIEDKIRDNLARFLQKNRWIVNTEVTTNNGNRTDIIAYHKKYEKLGTFVIEVKPDKNNSWNITDAHKQIVEKYQPDKVNGVNPDIYVFYSPWIPNPWKNYPVLKNNEYFGHNHWCWHFPTILRFFTKYGIGILPNSLDYFYFSDEKQKWSRLPVNPLLLEDNFDFSRLKKSLKPKIREANT